MFYPTGLSVSVSPTAPSLTYCSGSLDLTKGKQLKTETLNRKCYTTKTLPFEKGSCARFTCLCFGVCVCVWRERESGCVCVCEVVGVCCDYESSMM